MNLNQVKNREIPLRSVPKSSAPAFSFHRPSSNHLNSIVKSSPLKVPLNYAVSKIVSTLNKQPRNSRIRASKMTQRESRISNIQELPDESILHQLHSQVFEFLKKYFGGRNTSQIQTYQFIQALIDEYLGPINDINIIESLQNQLRNLLGQQYIVLWRLWQLTQQKGLSGLMMDICRTMKQSSNKSQFQMSRMYMQQNSINNSPQINNLKNVLTEFFQSMTKSIQKQIYSKFTKQMRRLVLKYNETQQLLKQINEKITQNYDKIKAKQLDKKKQISDLEQKILDYEIKIKSLEQQQKKKQIKYNLISKQNIKLIEENKKLLGNVYNLQEQLNTKKSDSYSKQKQVSTQSNDKSNNKNKQNHQYSIVSNFMVPNATTIPPRMTPLSPIRRTFSSNSNRNPYQFKQSQSKHRQQFIGINLTSNINPSKSRRNSKQNGSNMIYFA